MEDSRPKILLKFCADNRKDIEYGTNNCAGCQKAAACCLYNLLLGRLAAAETRSPVCDGHRVSVHL